MFLRWALASHPHLTFAVLGDNLDFISALSPSTPPDLPSRSQAGTWGSSLQSIQAPLRPGMIQGWGGIKGHSGFVRNEILDAYSEWAAHVMICDPSPLPLPPDRVHIQRPPPRHTQTDYHLNQAPPPLPQTRKHPRTVQLPFLQPHFMVPRPPFQMVLRKFQHGAVCVPRRPAPSPLPRLPRPAPNGCYLFRLTLPNVRTPVQTYIQCWRPPFDTVVSQWWSATTHVGERRNFVRGLVPMSLYTKLTTPPSGQRKPAHCHYLKLALKARVPLLLNALYRTLEWLKDNPPPAPLTPPTGPNSWGRPWSPYSTSHTALQRPPPAYHPPPSLPDKVAHKPPKRPRPPSPAAHAKARKHARQPPRPVRPLTLKRNTASQPQPEPPPPKRPLTIRDMFNLPPPLDQHPSSPPPPLFPPLSPA